uniref:Uncharacterized protein n=1 Tax=Haemonchus contortus TaxID=6289 RepID=A0A7I4YFA4_HAECO
MVDKETTLDNYEEHIMAIHRLLAKFQFNQRYCKRHKMGASREDVRLVYSLPKNNDPEENNSSSGQTYRQTDRQTDRQTKRFITYRQTDRQTDRQTKRFIADLKELRNFVTDIQTDGQTDRQTD